MSIQQDQFLINLADDTSKANEGAKVVRPSTSDRTQRQTAEVVTVDAGYHSVSIINKDGSYGDVYNGIRSIAGTSYNIGDVVELVWDRISPIPKITSSGGSGGSGDYVVVSALGFNS